MNIKDILEKHSLWLKDNSQGERADLSGADLKNASLSGADLSYASLSGVDLRSAYLSYADLRSAYLSGANLSGANLSYANLRNASLGGANLRSASLNGANLSDVDLRSASLNGANLRSANLRSASLNGVDLRSASLNGADLSYADLRNASLNGANLSYANYDQSTKFPPFLLVPQIGSFTGFKKARSDMGDVILTIYVPRSAKRINSPVGRKCRAEKVKILKVEDLKGNEVNPSKIWSTHDPNFHYKVGAWIKPDKFDEDFRVECISGIHFFITKEEAVAY